MPWLFKKKIKIRPSWKHWKVTLIRYMANNIKLRDSCTRLTSCHDNASRVNFNLTGNYLFVSTLQLNPCYVHCAWTNTSGISLLKLIIIYFNFRWLFWKRDLKKAQLFLHRFDRLFDVLSNQSNTLSYS